jgi:hypothetical protein
VSACAWRHGLDHRARKSGFPIIGCSTPQAMIALFDRWQVGGIRWAMEAITVLGGVVAMKGYRAAQRPHTRVFAVHVEM